MDFIKPIEDLTFSDDFMFGYIMHMPDICKQVLEKLLHIKIDKLVYPELQKSIQTFYESKGVRLDVYVKDSDRIFNIEIQNIRDKDLPKRTRYYQSMVDIDNLLKGDDYSQLKESFIIFICQYDHFKDGLPCYTFKNVCLENNERELDDKTTKVIFNSNAYEKEKDVAIKAFLKYINTRVPTDTFTKQLDSMVEKIKYNNKFRNEYLAMNLHDRDIKKQAFEDGLSQGLSEGISQGELQAKIETAKNLLIEKIPTEIVIRTTGLSKETVEQLSNEITSH